MKLIIDAKKDTEQNMSLIQKKAREKNKYKIGELNKNKEQDDENILPFTTHIKHPHRCFQNVENSTGQTT